MRDDCRAENADIAAIVSTNLPKDCKDLFQIREGVWVCSDKVVRPVAETLREILIQTSRLKLQNDGNTRKADLIYNYLSSTQFVQNVRSVLETFANMESDLATEKRAMTKAWKKREGQLDRITVGMSTMVGQILSITQGSIPELEKISLLQLPGESEEDDDEQENPYLQIPSKRKP